MQRWNLLKCKLENDSGNQLTEIFRSFKKMLEFALFESGQQMFHTWYTTVRETVFPSAFCKPCIAFLGYWIIHNTVHYAFDRHKAVFIINNFMGLCNKISMKTFV